MKELQNVYVTGLGITSSIGTDMETFTDSLKSSSHGFAFLSDNNNKITPQIGAVLKDFSFKEKLSQLSFENEEIKKQALKSGSRAPLSIQASILSAMEAWHDAQLDIVDIESERVGIVVGGQNISNNYQFGLLEKFLNNPEYLSPKYALHFLDTDHVGTVSEILQIKGEGFSIGGASASGNVALIKAHQMLQLGVVDACIVIGALADLSPMDLQGFYNIGAYGCKHFVQEPEKACRPFDKQHEGFIYGQACGCLILETKKFLNLRSTVNPYALFQGGVINLDANKMTDPNKEGEATAMTKALKQSGFDPQSIDYINSHGSSSPLGDNTEVAAIHDVFGKHLDKILINSTKSITGHCLYSAGIVEAIGTIAQMKGNFIHESRNLDEPIDEKCRFAQSCIENTKISHAISNSFGFGGINSSIVLSNML